MNASTGFDAAIAALKLAMSASPTHGLALNVPVQHSRRNSWGPINRSKRLTEIRIVREIALRLRHKGLAAEAGEAVLDVGRIADLARFAVTDHIDADGDLSRDDIGDGLGRTVASNAPWSYGWSWSFFTSRSTNACGLGRLPTWVVRIRSVLSFMAFPSSC